MRTLIITFREEEIDYETIRKIISHSKFGA